MSKQIDRIKPLAEKAYNTVNTQYKDLKPEDWIDAFAIEFSRNLVFECTDVIRESAKESGNEVAKNAIKIVAIDVLDHFGL